MAAEQTTILCIDDDAAIRQLVAQYFGAVGFQVVVAADGEEGLQLFGRQAIDIVLVDLRMPKIDGFGVLAALAGQAPDLPKLVISGEGEMIDVIKALQLGAWNYLTKPMDNMALIRHAVEQALEKARLIRENKAYQSGLEAKLGTIVDHFPGFLFSTDATGVISYMNPALRHSLGQEAQGRTWWQALFGLNQPWSAERYQPDKTVHEELQSQHDERWYRLVQQPVFDSEGCLREIQSLMLDINEQRLQAMEMLRSSMADRYKFGRIIGKSPVMQKVYETIVGAAASEAAVIIYGESGTGKELVAESVHRLSRRKERALIYVNCGAIPENLVESEFFGHKKGAFTGATSDKPGFLSQADGGTLFLDEVGEIPLHMQVKLLRAIEGNGFTALGDSELQRPDLRIIAATNRDLAAEVKKGSMRQDFLYRIHIIPIHLPPLRERRDDIRLLVDHFLGQHEPEEVPVLSPAMRRALQEYDWPGNVRELQNTLHRFVTLGELDFMGLDLGHGYGRQEDLVGGPAPPQLEEGRSLADMLAQVEKDILMAALERHNQHQGKTAKALAIDRRTLYRKMKQLGIAKQ